MNSPLVTVGVPVYRGQQELPVTLECLRTQTYPNLDVLISVDAADQESATACEPFLRRDPRFRMQVQPSRLGWAGNTDWTMRERRGEFYIFQQHDDQVSPTYVADLARALHHLVLRNARGLVHFANAGACSRYALAQAVLSVSGMSHVRLEPIRTDEAGRIAIRPAYAALDTSRYASLIGEGPRPWEEALRDYLDADRSRAGGG